MKTKVSAYALRLPASLKAEAERLAAEDGASLNQFVSTAVAEKVSALRTARYFADRKGRADWAAFDRLMSRDTGEPPRAGDEIPEEYARSKKKP
ncbi:YlcI/YnfO family protein [Methylocystis sp. Sn-Cys]|uniref:YlcI/YnfO family protein n=1 Tax=Methylocystis sp. Sn-Cys TaxID=1701263 RepID=UPI001922DF2A|nr:YlcI/YnfO family protein [Methylocystis sp. Sn-Cys]MBL1257240.1 toxin-antitoxin system HicB family antitoxin [Methylocystis sp. Sn-Cys]